MSTHVKRDQIDAIKERVGLDTIVAERGIELKRRGSHLFALCPFHTERTPSFAVNANRDHFHCFGCHLGGDVIDFVMRFDRVSFLEAVRTLAPRARITVSVSEGGEERGDPWR